MTELELSYIERCKDLTPFDTGNSLHVYHRFYKIDDVVVELHFAIEDCECIEINVLPQEGYKLPHERLDDMIKGIGEHLRSRENRQEILNSYKWIKLKKYKPIELTKNYPVDDWKIEYFQLLEHHKEETTFLIDYIRRLVRYIDQHEKELQNVDVFFHEDLSDDFKKSITSDVKPVSSEEIKRIKDNYQKLKSIMKDQ